MWDRPFTSLLLKRKNVNEIENNMKFSIRDILSDGNWYWDRIGNDLVSKKNEDYICGRTLTAEAISAEDKYCESHLRPHPVIGSKGYCRISCRSRWATASGKTL